MGFLHQFVRCQVSGVSFSMFSLYTKGQARYSARQKKSGKCAEMAKKECKIV